MKRLALALTMAVFSLCASAPAALADFGFKDFDLTFTNPDDSAVTLAGSHPFAMTTTFEVNTLTHPALGEIPDEPLKNLTVAQVPGLIGNATTTPRCTTTDFLASNPKAAAQCSDDTIVGTADSILITASNPAVKSPVFNLAPPPGTAAMLGFWVLTVPVAVEVGVADHYPYNIEARLRNISQTVPVIGSKVTIWGVPADDAHDAARGGPAGVAEKPFLTVPRACEGPLRTEYAISSWTKPQALLSGFSLTHDALGNPQGFDDCEVLGFGPDVAPAPTTDRTESPSGFEFAIDVDDPGLLDPDGRAESDLKKAVVTLPEGMTVNPAAAGGLAACTQAQLGSETAGSAPGEGCPNASRVATVEVTTPLLDELLTGSVFLAEPYANPLGTLLAGYLVIRSPERGIVVKLAGKIETDSSTGRLTASFDQNPQLPFSHLDVSFTPGPRAPLITPQTCGAYEVRTELYPWSGNAPDIELDAFPITQASGGGSCPTSPGALPHSPGFDAGAVEPLAGHHSPFVVNLRRDDGSQRFAAVTLAPPPGLTAKLAGIPSCPDSVLAVATSRSGKEEQASPSCPAASRVGSVSAAAGAGPAPYWAEGSAYLAGPYKGAPLSLAVITPAVAGPFDLGTVVIRTALHIDPRTAEITAVSDPIPSILEGIPLDVRAIAISMEKPQFTLNPTSCDPMAVNGVLTSTLGQHAPLSSRFQLAECGRLAFKPRMILSLKGGTKRGRHPALTAVLRPRPGDANIASLSLALPRSAFLDQSHIGTVCTRVQFAQDTCPERAIYGRVTAHTPLLDYPLTGNVYLRSSDNLLPDLVTDLRGPAHQPIRIESAGRTDSIRGGIRNTFDFIPDAPISRVVLQLRGGKKGLLINSRDICRGANRATAKFTAHNGRTYVARPKVMPQCGGKGRASRALPRRIEN